MDKDIHYWRSRALAGDTKELALLQENAELRHLLQDIGAWFMGTEMSNGQYRETTLNLAETGRMLDMIAKVLEPERTSQRQKEICPMCHDTGMCEQPVAAPAGVEIPKRPKIKCPLCRWANGTLSPYFRAF